MEKEYHDFKKEVESHSSNLTNQRIFNIKEELWKTSQIVMSSKSNPLYSLKYFSIVATYYIELPGIIEDEDDKVIELQIIEGNKIASKMRMFGTPSPKDSEKLLQISLTIHTMINRSLQKYKYFFRIGKPDAKGLEAALRMFGDHAIGDTKKVQTET